MRWRTTEPVVGNRRTKRKFLLWPRTFGGETRWLEWALVLEEYVLYPDFVGVPSPSPCWEEIGFAEEE